LVFDLTGSVDATKIAVSGNQIGTGIYTVNVFDGGGLTNGTYTLLTVAGTFQATDFVLGTTPIGYDSSYLQWSGGTLSLNVIPEPGSLALIGMAFGLVLLSRRKW
ncbi:MAG: PEP-CTERM sorting domain-containing protein, partial [Terrimicrobiaceae bacterium]